MSRDIQLFVSFGATVDEAGCCPEHMLHSLGSAKSNDLGGNP